MNEKIHLIILKEEFACDHSKKTENNCDGHALQKIKRGA